LALPGKTEFREFTDCRELVHVLLVDARLNARLQKTARVTIERAAVRDWPYRQNLRIARQCAKIARIWALIDVFVNMVKLRRGLPVWSGLYAEMGRRGQKAAISDLLNGMEDKVRRGRKS
jgi:hypothetical protein